MRGNRVPERKRPEFKAQSYLIDREPEEEQTDHACNEVPTGYAI